MRRPLFTPRGAGVPSASASAALLCLFLLALPGLAQAATRYVGTCGTPNSATVVAAVTAASAGDSILICPGAYNEAVTLNKDNLTLRSSTGNRADVTLSHSGTPLTLSSQGLSVKDMTLNSSNGTAINRPWSATASAYVFENLAISAKDYGIYVDVSGLVTLRNLSVESRNGNAIHLNSASDAAHVFENLTLTAKNYAIYSAKGASSIRDVNATSSNGTAIHFAGKYPATVANVTARADNGMGIYLAWSGFYNACTFTDVTVNSKDAGIQVNQSGKIILRRINATSSNGNGIYLEWGASGEHELEDITADGKNYGVYLERGGLSLVNISASGRNDAAAYVASRYATRFENLTLTSDNGRGLYIPWGGSSLAMSLSRVSVSAKENGIQVDQSGKLTLDRITVDSRNADAINLGWGASGEHVLSNLTLTADNGHGLYAGYGLGSVSDFTISAKTYGIYTISRYNLSIQRGIIESDDGSGIQIDSMLTAPNSIADVTIQAKDVGIRIGNSATPDIRRVCVRGADEGVRIDSSTGAGVIRDSSFSGYDDYGVTVRSSNYHPVASSGNCFLKSSTPRAYASSTAHAFNGNYWQGVAGGGAYSDGNVRDNATLASCPVLRCQGEEAAILVADWRMDEAGWNGTAAEATDSAVGARHGRAVNGASTVSGKLCRAGNFDGGNDYLSISGLSDLLNGSSSLAFWIKTSQTGNNTNWLAPGVTGVEQAGGINDIFWGWLDASGRIGINVGDDTSSKSTTAINDDTWRHVALTRDAGTGGYQIFLNGVLHKSGTTLAGVIGNAYASLGRIEDTGGTPTYFRGQLDEVHVFSGILNEAEVAAGYANEAAGRNWDGTARVCASAGPAALNAVDTGANPVSGQIATKTAGTGFNLDLHALNAGRTAADASATGDVLVDLLANTAAGVALDANNCPTSGTSLAVGTATLTAGAASIAVPAVADAWRDVRVRLRYPAAGPYTLTACSADNFAVKPSTLTAIASDADWGAAGTARTLANTGATGGVVHKAGQPFTLRVTGYNAASVVTSQYDGAVAASVSCVLPVSGCVAGTLSSGSFSASGGTLVSHTASFSEAGAIAVSFTDTTFAAVDSDDSAASCAGFHVCSGAINVGRFVPDHYDVVSIQSPLFQTFGSACASRSFTYVGQEFGFATLPRARVTAKNAAGGTTANAKGTLWKLSPNGHFGSSWRCQKSDGASCGSVSVTSAGFSAGNLVSNSDGTGDFTWPTNLMAPNGVKYSFTRSHPAPAPFNAEIGLGIVIRDSSEAGNCGLASCLMLDTQPANPPTWGSNIAFDAGNAFRQGRLRLANAAGSELLPLPVSLTAQYWTGQGWASNTADQCSAVSAPTLTFFTQSADNHLASGETTASFNANLVAGYGNLRFSAPGAGNFGFLDAVVTAPAWLKHNWDGVDQSGDGDLLDDDPRARVSFGKRAGSSKVILRRELY